jgi:uncharacterized protein YeaO (DUF488 family)
MPVISSSLVRNANYNIILAFVGTTRVEIKRAYVPSDTHDGFRVLVDRLWPRGVRKGDLRLDAWMKDVAPTPSLRKWFGHDPDRFAKFAARYHEELARSPAKEALADLVHRASEGPVTLVYGARDETHNGAVVLREAMKEALRKQRGGRH